MKAKFDLLYVTAFLSAKFMSYWKNAALYRFQVSCGGSYFGKMGNPNSKIVVIRFFNYLVSYDKVFNVSSTEQMAKV